MKREGRQHGMVRTYRILPAPLNQTSVLRFVNQIDTPPTAGLFTKVSSKPTNHSKSTGLTNSKGNKSKRRSNKKHKAIFIDGFHFSGASASGIVSSFHRYEDACDSYSEDDVEEADQQLNPLTISEEMEPGVGDQNEDHEFLQDASVNDEEQIDKETSSEEEDEIVVDEDGGAVTIGEVVILLEQVVDEEDWCFVGADQDQF